MRVYYTLVIMSAVRHLAASGILQQRCLSFPEGVACIAALVRMIMTLVCVGVSASAHEEKVSLLWWCMQSIVQWSIHVDLNWKVVGKW